MLKTRRSFLLKDTTSFLKKTENGTLRNTSEMDEKVRVDLDHFQLKTLEVLFANKILFFHRRLKVLS